MKRIAGIAAAMAVMALGMAGVAHAGVLGTVKTWLTGEAAALVASAAAALIAGLSGVMYSRVTRTFREAGEFLAAVGTALEDHRVTREELAAIVREGRDIFAVWQAEPAVSVRDEIRR